ncbi:hypothetical protein V6C32_18535 [Desulforamulus ruminis]|uniref:Uncharacterized protein n=1 Tax=Desulforamulus ruminis (strain ATCC 23193 / DSM 2154 / NCIMB 8452 / DL) TaxID=696281 RepID=F6DRQ9_DESRL|nr:hypothetical protein [Desulforamulus ruminis]AEG59820.1 hypothetical protein Desru_1555 [Desulforamulus ruminis DSM 2154]
MGHSYWHKILAGLILCMVIFFAPQRVIGAESTAGAERVILVIIDKVSIDDYQEQPLVYLKGLTERGSVGLLNNNTGSGIYSEHTYPSIGGGAHLVGSGEAYSGFGREEEFLNSTAAEEYLRRTGIESPPASIVQLSIGKLQRLNQALRYPAQPGALGENLHQAHLKTAVIGNADTPGVQRRLATTISMDSRGLTDWGVVDEQVVRHQPEVMGAWRTDFDEVMKRILEYREKGASLIVVETGDATRIHEERDKGTDPTYARQRAQVLSDIDGFVGNLLENVDLTKEILLVVTPTPTSNALKQSQNLTPVFALGPGFAPGTLLTSGTTKRDGIVMNTDIAPTVLKALDLPSSVDMSGRSFLSSDMQFKGNPFDYLIDLNQSLVTTYQARSPLQSAYVLVQIIVLLVALYGIFFKRHMAEIIKPFLLLVMAVPLAELLMPLLPNPSVAVMALELIVMTSVIAGLSILANRRLGLAPFIFICIASAGIILGDILNGSYLQKQALLSYDPIVGARFYGIGNEYMGVLIGSLIIGVTASIQYWEKWKKPFIALTGFIFLFAIYTMAAPHLGTNVGGAIAMTSAFLVTFFLLVGVRLRLHVLLLIGLLVLGAVAGFIAFDLTRPPDLRSHMGNTAALILASGPEQALEIIQRKWQMNMKLLRYTVWSRVLILSLAVLALFFYRPRGIMEHIRKKYAYLFKGFIGVVTGALVAFAFNDSGVVAAATTMIFGVPPLAYLILTEQKTRGKEAT